MSKCGMCNTTTQRSVCLGSLVFVVRNFCYVVVRLIFCLRCRCFRASASSEGNIRLSSSTREKSSLSVSSLFTWFFFFSLMN